MDPKYLFYLIVLSGALLVFLADSIGNRLSFRSRISNALTTAVVWGILFIGLYFVLGVFGIALAGSLEGLLFLALKGALTIFIADMIGNYLVFNNRLINAMITSIIWAGFFIALNAFGFL